MVSSRLLTEGTSTRRFSSRDKKKRERERERDKEEFETDRGTVRSRCLFKEFEKQPKKCRTEL
jgi:hypothetical protein